MVVQTLKDHAHLQGKNREEMTEEPSAVLNNKTKASLKFSQHLYLHQNEVTQPNLQDLGLGTWPSQAVRSSHTGGKKRE